MLLDGIESTLFSDRKQSNKEVKKLPRQKLLLHWIPCQQLLISTTESKKQICTNLFV
jgi:hypothetical protein